MRPLYAVHIAAGILSLLCGYVALYAAKGGALHRRSGTVFVYTMLVMCVGGFTIAVTRDVAQAVNVPAAALTSYLVITSLTTVRPLAAGGRGVLVGGLIVALVIVASMAVFTAEAFANGGTRRGMPAFPFIMFGVAGLFGAIGDVRVLRNGALKGTARVARHLWRMCFALFIAALSFFIGQAQVIPEPIRIRPLLAIPVVLVLATMFYWLWRVRFRRSLRGLVMTGARAIPRSDEVATTELLEPTRG
jgi:uncharacterized membrane protein